jgi:hypothetical protein
VPSDSDHRSRRPASRPTRARPPLRSPSLRPARPPATSLRSPLVRSRGALGTATVDLAGRAAGAAHRSAPHLPLPGLITSAAAPFDRRSRRSPHASLPACACPTDVARPQRKQATRTRPRWLDHPLLRARSKRRHGSQSHRLLVTRAGDGRAEAVIASPAYRGRHSPLLPRTELKLKTGRSSAWCMEACMEQ